MHCCCKYFASVLENSIVHGSVSGKNDDNGDEIDHNENIHRYRCNSSIEETDKFIDDHKYKTNNRPQKNNESFTPGGTPRGQCIHRGS